MSYLKLHVRKMAFMVKFLNEWNGHQPDTYQYLDELQAEILIKKGIAEPIDGTMSQRPHHFIMGAIR
jgi:hypothetical protein